MASIADFTVRVARDRLLAKALYEPASEFDLANLRERVTDMPLGLLETHALHDGCDRPGGLLAFLSPIRDRGTVVPWLGSARWLSIESGNRARERALEDGWPLADTDVVFAVGKADHTWLVADARQQIRALYWRVITTPRGSQRVRCQPTANQSWPQLIEAFCKSVGRFELQTQMQGEAEDERTLEFVTSTRGHGA